MRTGRTVGVFDFEPVSSWLEATPPAAPAPVTPEEEQGPVFDVPGDIPDLEPVTA